MTEMKLLRKAKFWAHVLGLLPGVRAIFLSGSLAQGRANEKSDIDFFIVARQGKIWTARFFVFLLLKAVGEMRTEKSPAGKICPNHFITDAHLRIRERDAYAAKLFTHNKPLFDPDGMLWYFVQENQDWVQKFGEYFPVFQSQETKLKIRKPCFFETWFESCVAWAQKEKIKRNPEYHLRNAKIVLEESELRFHPKPKNRRENLEERA